LCRHEHGGGHRVRVSEVHSPDDGCLVGEVLLHTVND